MRENRFFIRSAELEPFTPSRIAGKPAFLQYSELIERLEPIVGGPAASLFAEPVLPRGADGEGGTISWYSSYQGPVVGLDEIDEVARKPILDKLTTRLEALRPALADPAIGARFARWLDVAGPDDVVVIGGEPVIVNWGLLPQSVSSPEERKAHFARTLGRFAPTLLGSSPFPSAAATNGNETAPDAAARAVGTLAPPPPLGTRPAIGVAAATPRRPWLAPLVACLAAGAALVLLALPGVLIFPEASARNPVAEKFEIDRLKASNDSLESQLKALDDALDGKVCRPANFSVPVPGLGSEQTPGAPDATPTLQIDPKAPDKAEIPAPRGQAGQGAETVGALLEKTTVLVIAVTSAKGGEVAYSLGTGFLIGDRYVVTNHHVVEHAEPSKIFVANKSLGGIRQVRTVTLSLPPPVDTDIRVDLAALEIDPVNGAAALAIGSSPPKLTTAYIAGFPGFLTQRDSKFQNFIHTVAQGVIKPAEASQALQQQNIELPSADMETGAVNNTMNTGSGSLPIVLHDMQIAKGNSGGPLVDGCGRLIGVNTWLFPSDAGTRQGNVAQDVVTVRHFLTENNIPFTADDSVCAPGAPRPQASAEPGAPAPRPSPSPSPQKP